MKLSAKQMLDEHGPVETFQKARELAREYVYDLRGKGTISFSEPSATHHPTIHVVRRTIPEIWETTTIRRKVTVVQV